MMTGDEVIEAIAPHLGRGEITQCEFHREMIDITEPGEHFKRFAPGDLTITIKVKTQ